jgi:hypothetical protein
MISITDKLPNKVRREGKKKNLVKYGESAFVSGKKRK